MTCATNNTDISVLEWMLSIPPALSGNTNWSDYVRYVQNEGDASLLNIRPLTFNDTTFTFTRKSDQEAVPFVAEVVVNRVTADLNGTVIVCDESTRISTNVIHVIGGRQNN